MMLTRVRLSKLCTVVSILTIGNLINIGGKDVVNENISGIKSSTVLTFEPDVIIVEFRETH